MVSILTGVAIIAGLFGGMYPAKQVQAQILPGALLSANEIDDLLEIGDIDDVLGVRLLPIRGVLDDEFALRDLLITRITRLLVLRATIHGDLSLDDLDTIVFFVRQLQQADVFQLLQIHRLLQLQLARFIFLDDVRFDLGDLLLFRGFGISQLLLFRDFEREDILEEFRADLRPFRFGFADDLAFRAGLHLRLNGVFARRALVVDDLENRILPEKRVILADEVALREQRLVQRPILPGVVRQQLAQQREIFFQQRLQQVDAERQIAPRPPVNEVPPRVAPKPPVNEPPAPRVAPRPPVNEPIPPRVAPRPPVNEPIPPRVAPRPPVNEPIPPRVVPRPPVNEPIPPRVAPRPPVNEPPAPRVVPRPPVNEVPPPRVAPRPPVQRPAAPRVAPRAPAARPAAPRAPVQRPR
jgi:hypothetical protein